MAINKVVYGGQPIIDLTSDTVDKSKLLKGTTAHDKSGEVITGTCEYDVNSQDATVGASEVLKGKTAYARGTKLTGTMPNNGSVAGTINNKDDIYTVPQGYHDGSGKVQIDTTEKAKLVANNIRAGVTILGVEGSMSGSEDSKPQSKEVTPTSSEQTILPDSAYNCLSQVKVNAIPYVESANSAGGTTVTIG